MKVGAVVVSLVLALVACSGSDGATAPTTSVAATTTILTAEAAELAGLPQLQGLGQPLGPYDPAIYELDIGACFILLPINVGQTLTEFVLGRSCEETHEHEMYFTVEHPAGRDERYPGEDAMREWALRRCYETFQDFVGQIYELSALEIGFSMPPREYWEDSARRFRRVSCWVGDNDGVDLVGTARGTAR